MNIRDRIVALERLPASELQTNTRNWRVHPDSQKGALSGVLKEIGIAGALLAYRSPRAGNQLVLLDGHARKEIHDGTWPVLITDLNDAEADLVLATYDPLAAMAQTDTARLEDLLRDVTTDDAGLLALLATMAEDGRARPDDVALVEDPGADLDRADEMQRTWQVQRGQIWEIPSNRTPGRSHRLLCGDSTSSAESAALLAGGQPAMLWSDPPYGLGGYAGRSGKLAPVEGDDADVATLLSFYRAGDAPEMYVCTEFKTYPLLVRARGIPRSLIVWAKNVFGMGNGYRRQHEFIGYWGSFKGTTESDLWSESKDSQYIHPTQKPPTLAARALTNSTVPGDIVHCPFSGSGDAFIAAEQTGRLCSGMEIDPRYCAVILERLRGMQLRPRRVETALQEAA